MIKPRILRISTFPPPVLRNNALFFGRNPTAGTIIFSFEWLRTTPQLQEK
jgi:hypothetical protein